MSAMSDFLEQNLGDHVLNNNTYTSPNPIFIALFTSATTDAGGGTEVTGGSYARVSVDSSVTDQWNTPTTSGLFNNINALTFAQATANWGTVTNTAIYDASSGGNSLLHGALTASRTVNNGDTFEFAAGAFDITWA